MKQYTLSLPLSPLFCEDNFIVSDCNREAWQWIKAWPEWSTSGSFRALLLYGPSGCGKSHLGHIWVKRASASILSARSLNEDQPIPKNLLIEDIEQIESERTLLHLFNISKELAGNLLLTSTHSASQLPFALPDLTSRLLALPSAYINQPDDEVLAGVMRKQFIDRQMKVDDEIIAYILPRVERSFGKIQELVDTLDQSALAEHKNITIPFVKRILG